MMYTYITTGIKGELMMSGGHSVNCQDYQRPLIPVHKQVLGSPTEQVGEVG